MKKQSNPRPKNIKRPLPPPHPPQPIIGKYGCGVITDEMLKSYPQFRKPIYAGLDKDGIVKLFMVSPDGVMRNIGHQEWIDILSKIDNSFAPGEMPIVTLKKST